MSVEGCVRVIALLCSGVLLAGCADMAEFRQWANKQNTAPRLTPDQLNDQCPQQEKSHLWTKECWEWKQARDEAAAAKRRAEDARRREADAAAYLEEQQRKQREAQEREMAAVQADERAGYKYLSFEDFALDAAKMQGAKVALYGIYVGEGKRLASNQLAALMWIERARSTKGALIPLYTEDAAREARATLLRCDASPVGCTIVVKGRVRMLTLRNAFGSSSQELGVVVESVR